MFKETSIEKFFVFLSLIFGLIYIFILPPFQSVDEQSHFYRSYEIISGSFVAKRVGSQAGDYLPASLEQLFSKYAALRKNFNKKTSAEDILNSASIKLSPKKVKFITFTNTALYSPVCYLTQLPGMFIAKSFNANPLIIFYMGRISNLLFFTMIMYFSIKIIPFYKTTLMLLALMPMTLSLGGALTSDVMVIGLNFLWIAIILKFIFEKREMNNLELCCFILLASIIALCKDYFLLIPLIFLLPKSNFTNTKRYFVVTLSIFLIALIGCLLWQHVIDRLSFNMNVNANAAEQFKFMITNPINYLFIFVKSLLIKTPKIIITIIGVLGWQDTRLDFLTYLLYPILLLLSLNIDNDAEFKFQNWQINLITIDIIISIFLIYSNMYMMWSKIASPIIYGINGKYFTPLSLPFLLIFYNYSKFNLPSNAKLIIFITIILILISSDLSILYRFYNIAPTFNYDI